MKYLIFIAIKLQVIVTLDTQTSILIFFVI